MAWSAGMVGMAWWLAAQGMGGGTVTVGSVAAVASMLGGVTVVDAREEGAFESGHLPGSVRMRWDEWTEEKPGALNLLLGSPARWGRVPPPDDALQMRLRALGLHNARTVVVVGDPEGWGEEGRVAWNLLYWGADAVVLMDGGFPAWVRAGMPVARGRAAAPAAAGTFVLAPRAARRALLADVVELGRVAHPGRALLDARTPEEFEGRRVAGQSRGGHVPGARLVPHRALYAADGRYVDAATLAALMGGLPAGGAVTYCTGGVRSALLAVLLEARLGVVAANHDGSLWEYARSPAPLTTTPAPRGAPAPP